MRVLFVHSAAGLPIRESTVSVSEYVGLVSQWYQQSGLIKWRTQLMCLGAMYQVRYKQA